MPRQIQRSAVGAGFLFLTVAFAATTGGLNSGGVLALWVLAVIMLVCAWRCYLVPYVALTPESVVVQGASAQRSVRYSSIRDVQPGLYGLRIRTARQESVIGWAVQRSKWAEWSHRQTMADEVVAEVMERVQLAPPSPARRA